MSINDCRSVVVLIATSRIVIECPKALKTSQITLSHNQSTRSSHCIVDLEQEWLKQTTQIVFHLGDQPNHVDAIQCGATDAQGLLTPNGQSDVRNVRNRVDRVQIDQVTLTTT